MRAARLLLLSSTLAACGGGGPGSTEGPPTIARTDGGQPLTCPASEKPVGTASAIPATQVQHLGVHPVGDAVSFDVPPDAVSVTVIEQAVNAPDFIQFQSSAGSPAATIANVAVPLQLREPAGMVVYDDTRPPPADPSGLPAFFASSSPGTGTLGIPNTTAGLALLGTAGLPAGAWSLTVSDLAYECTSPPPAPLPPGASCAGGSRDSTYDVTVLTKQGGSIPAAGAIAVTFHLVSDQTANPSRTLPAAAAAPGDPDLQRMVNTLGQLLGDAGLTLRTPTWLDAPAEVKARYAGLIDVDQTGACGPLAQLLKTSVDGTSLHIFLVAGFTSASLQASSVIVGIDGSIPGPATVAGTVASGAAVATADLRSGACSGPVDFEGCGDDRTAYVIAHEAGHYLGLYHVTESQGTLFDPLADTPTCPCSACKPATATARCADASPAPAAGAEYLVTVADCTRSSTCGGGDDLMFWILDQGSRGTITPEQKSVVLANPLVQ